MTHRQAHKTTLHSPSSLGILGVCASTHAFCAPLSICRVNLFAHTYDSMQALFETRVVMTAIAL